MRGRGVTALVVFASVLLVGASITAYARIAFFDSEQFGLGTTPGSQDEEDYLGLPGLLEPDQMASLLRSRQKPEAARAVENEQSAHRALAATRKELNALVSAYARRTSAPHAVVHADLRRQCGGPALDRATHEEVQERIETIRRWFVGRR